MQKDIYVRFDWAMKRMLRDKASFVVLEGLLTVLLGEQITIIEILESESNQESYDDKFNRVDIKVKDSRGDLIIVEIQNTREYYFLERILFGTSKAVTEHIKLGQTYKEVKKVISISILYFDLGKGKDYLYHGQTKFIGVHTHDELQVTEKEREALGKKPEDIFPEYYLIRVNEFDRVAKTPLEQWIRYLKTGEINDNDSAPGLSEARERLRVYNMTKNEQIAYDRHMQNLMIENDTIDTAKKEGLAEGRAEGLAEGRAEGRAEGLAEGRQKERIEIARKLKASGTDVTMIAVATGLSEDEIKKI